MSDFESIAARLGHDLNALKAGQEITTTILVQDVDELRQLFYDTLPEAAKKSRAESVRRSPLPEVHDVSPAAILRRVQAHVFGDEPLAPADRERIRSLFPMPVTAASIENKTLGPGEVWNLGTSTSAVTQNIGTLTMEPGSSIVIRNTVLRLDVETLVRNAGGTGAPYDLGILGSTGPTGQTGDGGGAGGSGDVGTSGTCDSGGGIAKDPGGPGTTGPSGATGGFGGQGGEGFPALPATINISRGITGSAGQFVILTKSGTGGQGGPGGRGGTGGVGGAGGAGSSCGCEGTNGGNGGRGGAGGVGGRGGTGGNGTDGNDVTVTVPKGQADLIVKLREKAPAGLGGPGGGEGPGGPGGGGGAGGGAGACPSHTDGSAGGTGPAGGPGPLGSEGTLAGNPGDILVNET